MREARESIASMVPPSAAHTATGFQATSFNEARETSRARVAPGVPPAGTISLSQPRFRQQIFLERRPARR